MMFHRFKWYRANFEVMVSIVFPKKACQAV